MVLPVVCKYHSFLPELMSLCILLGEVNRKVEDSLKMSLGQGVSSVTSAVAKQLSNTHSLGLLI